MATIYLGDGFSSSISTTTTDFAPSLSPVINIQLMQTPSLAGYLTKQYLMRAIDSLGYTIMWLSGTPDATGSQSSSPNLPLHDVVILKYL